MLRVRGFSWPASACTYALQRRGESDTRPLPFPPIFGSDFEEPIFSLGNDRAERARGRKRVNSALRREEEERVSVAVWMPRKALLLLPFRSPFDAVAIRRRVEGSSSTEGGASQSPSPPILPPSKCGGGHLASSRPGKGGGRKAKRPWLEAAPEASAAAFVARPQREIE